MSTCLIFCWTQNTGLGYSLFIYSETNSDNIRTCELCVQYLQNTKFNVFSSQRKTLSNSPDVRQPSLKSLYYIFTLLLYYSSVLYLTDFIINSITYEPSVTNEFFMFHSVNTVLLQLHFLFKTCFYSHNILSYISFIKSYIKILSLNICLVVLIKHYSPQINSHWYNEPQHRSTHTHKPITGQILITQTAFLIHHIN